MTYTYLGCRKHIASSPSKTSGLKVVTSSGCLVLEFGRARTRATRNIEAELVWGWTIICTRGVKEDAQHAKREYRPVQQAHINILARWGMGCSTRDWCRTWTPELSTNKLKTSISSFFSICKNSRASVVPAALEASPVSCRKNAVSVHMLCTHYLQIKFTKPQN